MKIAISADGPDLYARVGHKLGNSKYLVIVDIDKGDYEAMPNPEASGQRGAGIQVVLLAVSKEAKTIITGYCSPTIAGQFKASGIEVVTGISGTVKEAIDKYRKGELKQEIQAVSASKSKGVSFDRGELVHATRISAKQFVNLLPILIAVVLLIGLFNAFISKELLTSIFSGNTILDTLWGASFGSILAGNPINSYIIGGELLDYGVSLFAVTAFVIAWVTVGLVQLPIEVAALGKKFALLRNVFSFILSIIIAMLAVTALNLLGGRIL